MDLIQEEMVENNVFLCLFKLNDAYYIRMVARCQNLMSYAVQMCATFHYRLISLALSFLLMRKFSESGIFFVVLNRNPARNYERRIYETCLRLLAIYLFYSDF